MYLEQSEDHDTSTEDSRFLVNRSPLSPNSRHERAFPPNLSGVRDRESIVEAAGCGALVALREMTTESETSRTTCSPQRRRE